MKRIEKYKIIKKELLEHKKLLESETYGIEKIDFQKIIDIQDIIDLILEDERKGIHLLKYIELKNISFEEQNIEGVDFTGTNASIDPQTIKNKSLRGAILSGINFKNKSFDNVIVTETNFTGALNIDLDPQTIEYSSLYGTILTGIDFNEKSFKNICIFKTDFRGAKNVKIVRQEIWARRTMEQPGEKNEYPNLPIFDENIEIIDEEQEENEFKKRLSLHILEKVPKCI